MNNIQTTIKKYHPHNRIQLNEQHTGFIIGFNDAAILGCLGWAIEQYLDVISPKPMPTRIQRLIHHEICGYKLPNPMEQI